MSYYDRSSRDTQLEWLGIAAVIGVVIAVITGLIWFVFGYWLDNWNIFTKWLHQDFWVANIHPGGLTFTGFAWLMIALVALVVGTFAGRDSRNGLIVTVVAFALFAVSLATGTTKYWNNDKDGARSYAGSTVFVVDDLNKTPRSLASIVDNASTVNSASCNGLQGNHDVYSCIEQGKFPSGWNRRVVSATGATTVMSRTSGDVTNTYLMNDTIAYLYGAGDTGKWSAVRDGKNRQSVYGIVTWDGSGNQPVVCRFEGDYSMNYAFAGRWGRNLNDELADRYPNLLYQPFDIWGYCDNAQPVIVIPVTQQEPYESRTTRRSAGVLVIKGSPSGEPNIQHIKSVKAGEFPGPVYPKYLTDQQREAIKWASGRANMNRLKFGYEDTNVASQEGNTENYLLRSVDDGRLYWVTPLKPRSTESQQLVAYSVTPADEATNGELNRQKVYVVSDDQVVANLDDLNSRVTDAVSTTNPGFFTTDPPGRIAEFLPVNSTTWQVYAERNGRVVYRIDVSADARITPKVYMVTSESGGVVNPTPTPSPGTTPAATNCGANPAELTDKALAQCLSQLASELQRRQS